MFLYTTFVENIEVFKVILLVSTVIYIIHRIWNTRTARSPPGTNGIPFLGVLPSLRTYPERVLSKWGKQYGPIYMTKLGFTDVVVIGSPEIAYEAFAKSDDFNDRPLTIPMFDGDGIILANRSGFHKHQRRFCLNTLRDFGMGRRSLEPRLVEVSQEICRKIDRFITTDNHSPPQDISGLIFDSISQVISLIIFGHDVANENENFHALVQELIEPKSVNVLLGLTVFVPFLRHLPVFSKAWTDSEIYRDKIHVEIQAEIEEHIKTNQPSCPRDFIDCFLNEMNRTECDYENSDQNDDDDLTPKTSFKSKQLVGIVRDLFLAGTDTTGISILWILLYLSKYTEVQDKMQEEIDGVLGHSGTVCMALLDKLPYCRAVIQETARLRPVVPLSVPHLVARDSSLRGYQLSKGTIILTNIWGIHHDERRWPEPDEFRPERHLDENGSFIKSPDWMSFSVGARSCLGRQLAIMELFIMTVTLFQHFKFKLPGGSNPDMRGESKISLHPWHYKVVISRR